MFLDSLLQSGIVAFKIPPARLVAATNRLVDSAQSFYFVEPDRQHFDELSSLWGVAGDSVPELLEI